MARKRIPENDLVVSSGAAAARPRRTSTARPKHSPTTAEPPVSSPIETAEESPLAVSHAPLEVSHEQIARLAYVYWLARGCQNGSAEEDWLRAEQELRSQTALSVA
ncbi:MAG: hypothetical protein C5B51_32220 [Terriglobia bacterium]|nr:MAG: hypothetical protein C5B51_32220 [Terriglobia bacterium]